MHVHPRTCACAHSAPLRVPRAWCQTACIPLARARRARLAREVHARTRAVAKWQQRSNCQQRSATRRAARPARAASGAGHGQAEDDGHVLGFRVKRAERSLNGAWGAGRRTAHETRAKFTCSCSEINVRIQSLWTVPQTLILKFVDGPTNTHFEFARRRRSAGCLI